MVNRFVASDDLVKEVRLVEKLTGVRASIVNDLTSKPGLVAFYGSSKFDQLYTQEELGLLPDYDPRKITHQMPVGEYKFGDVFAELMEGDLLPELQGKTGWKQMPRMVNKFSSSRTGQISNYGVFLTTYFGLAVDPLEHKLPHLRKVSEHDDLVCLLEQIKRTYIDIPMDLKNLAKSNVRSLLLDVAAEEVITTYDTSVVFNKYSVIVGFPDVRKSFEMGYTERYDSKRFVELLAKVEPDGMERSRANKWSKTGMHQNMIHYADDPVAVFEQLKQKELGEVLEMMADE